MKEKKKGLPKIALWILRHFSVYEEYFDITRDFEEVYQQKRFEGSIFSAKLWFWSQILKTLFYYMGFQVRWRINMFKNYLKIALRNFYKRKIYSFINITGLAVGMACCMLIMLWVQDEWHHDKFNKNIERIFSVASWDSIKKTKHYSSSIPSPLIPYLRDKYSEIKHASRFLGSGRCLFSYKGNHFFEKKGGFADPALFDVFSFKPAMNDPKVALKDINTIILTKSMAEKYFGSEDPLGKTIKLENRYAFLVGAIIEDIPGNSSVQFDYLIPFENYGRFNEVEMDDWGRYEGYKGFIVLNDNVDHKGFGQKIAEELKNIDPQTPYRLALFPYKDLRIFGLNNNGSFKFVRIFSIFAVLILMMACINFINLATAQSGNRAKEIGLRKVVGASRSVIRRQIYSELFVTVAMAFLLAVILSIVFLPVLNSLMGKTLSFFDADNPGIIFIMLGIALLTGIMSGTYPALFLSSFSPGKVLKSVSPTGSTSPFLRKLLVVVQFTISIGLIISAFVIGKQMNYVKNKGLGFDQEHLAYLELVGDLRTGSDTLKNELLKNPSINGVTATQSLPNNVPNFASGLDWEGKPAYVRGGMNFISVEKDYFKTAGIEFVEGETFKLPPNNDFREFIVNEKAIEFMQIGNPVGKSFKMWDRAAGKIIGIVKNVHNVSLHREIRPAFYIQCPGFYNYILINLKNENLSKTIDFIKNECKKINPNYPCEFYFLDENIDRYYRNEKQTNKLIIYFTLLALFISCLGLFGLSLFMAEQRVKEIGIRKTLGATISSIVGLMSRDFLLLVAVSNLIAWPAAYFIMNQWLQNFVYRTDFGISIFLVSAVIGVFIAFFTISFQSMKVAMTNPVDSLRYE